MAESECLTCMARRAVTQIAKIASDRLAIAIPFFAAPVRKEIPDDRQCGTNDSGKQGIPWLWRSESNEHYRHIGNGFRNTQWHEKIRNEYSQHDQSTKAHDVAATLRGMLYLISKQELARHTRKSGVKLIVSGARKGSNCD